MKINFYTTTYKRQFNYPQNLSFNGFFLLTQKQKLMNKILDDGYDFYRKIDIINPESQAIKGMSFVKDGLDTRDRKFSTILTNEDGLQVGELQALQFPFENSSVYTTIRNYTKKTIPSISFLPPRYQTVPLNSGTYRRIGTEAYNILDEELLRKHPQITMVMAPITNAGSWDFHCKIGFDGAPGCYDYYGGEANVLSRKVIPK